jgi:hypothetical protein
MGGGEGVNGVQRAGSGQEDEEMGEADESAWAVQGKEAKRNPLHRTVLH